MGLIAAECERQGMATAVIQPFVHVAKRLRPPRGLLVPFPLGHPLGTPNDPDAQHDVIEAMLRLLETAEAGPTLVAYQG